MSVFSHIRYAAKSDVGRKRKNNEDAFGLCPSIGAFCVADGMGGGDDGEVASAATVRAVETFAKEHPFPANAAYSAVDVAAGLCASINGASAWIAERARARRLKGCGSTFVGVVFDASRPDLALALHAGDSRLYRIRGRSIQQMTKDHSAAELIGAKNESEVNPMFRGMILRAVGVESSVEIERTPVSVQGGDLILICSDGLTRMVPDDRMLSIVRGSESVERAVDALIGAANAAGGVDNVTVELLEIGTLPVALPAVAMPRSGDGDGAKAASPRAGDAAADADTQRTDDTGSTDPSVGTAGTTEEPLPLSEEDPIAKDGSVWRGICRRKVAVALVSLLAIVVIGGGLGLLLLRDSSPAAAEEAPGAVAVPQPLQAVVDEVIACERVTGTVSRAETKDAEVPGRDVGEKPSAVPVGAGEGDERRRLEALVAFEEVCETDVAAAFVRKAIGILGREVPDSISTRFRPLTHASTRSREEKLAAAVALTKDVQTIVGKLIGSSQGYLKDIEAQLKDPATTDDCRRELKEATGRIAEFLENANPFVAGDPANPDVQFKCILMIHSVPRWF